MSQVPLISCEIALRLLAQIAQEDKSITRQDSDAFVSHVTICAQCAEVVCLVGNLGEGGSSPPDNYAWTAARMGMTVKEGWHDLLRRRPDLAAAYRGELRQERFRGIWRRIGAVSALAACFLIAMVVGLRLRLEYSRGLTAFIDNRESSKINTPARTDHVGGELALGLPDDPFETVPNLAKTDYADWRDQHGDWFVSQFPWIADVRSSAPNCVEQSDYVERLALSGDLFQFQGKSLRAADQAFATLQSGSIERNASDSVLWGGAKAPAPSDDVIKRWMDAVASAQRAGEAEQTPVLLFSLEAGRYLANTRTAAALWVIHHGDEAKALFAPHDGPPKVHGVALPTTRDAGRNLPQFFERQALAASQIMRISEDLLSVSPDPTCISNSNNRWEKLLGELGKLRGDRSLP